MSNAVDAHLAIISQPSEPGQKRMTSGGAIPLGSTLVAGVYALCI